MPKKSKESGVKINTEDNLSLNSKSVSASTSSSIFETLFGAFVDKDRSDSVLSDRNHFGRKPSNHSQSPQQEQKKHQSPSDANGSSESAGVTFRGSDGGELTKKKEKKRNREKIANLDSVSLEEASDTPLKTKKSKKLESGEPASELVQSGNRNKGKNRDSDTDSKNLSRKEKENEGRASEEGKRNPKLETESIELRKDHRLELELNLSVSLKNERKEKLKEHESKKRKRDELEAEYEAKRYGAVAESKEGSEGGLGGAKVGEKRKKRDNPEDTMVAKEGFDDELKLLRTVFVGNLPLKVKKKVLIREFSKFGEVESVRIRSVPILDSKKPRKVAILKKQINDSATSVNAYVVFRTEESAQASLSRNMSTIGENHIRVDRACPPRKKLKGDDPSLFDITRTVFVGNLPFDVKDEEIYHLFSSVNNLESSIEAIRVIRDPNTSLGKGIAYILFKTTGAANLIVRKRNLKLRDRELRLSRAKSNSTPSKRKSESFAERNYGSPPNKLAFGARTPGSFNKSKPKAATSYQGLRASKSGAPKKFSQKFLEKPKSTLKASKLPLPKEHARRRPTVADRKANMLKGADGTPKHAGIKRKPETRTPDGTHGNKKARTLR